MAFRTTGISPVAVFHTARAPGVALERGLGGLFEGIREHLILKRELADEEKKEADAINIFRAARQGDINSLFDTITDGDNAGLALNLANVLTTKNQIDAQAALRRAQAVKVKGEEDAENEFFASHGHDLLGAVRENLTLSPEVSVNERVPVLAADGTAVLKDGQPVFETRTRKIADAVVERNPLYDVVARLRESGQPLTPKVVKMILGENERIQKAAATAARERGLNARAAETSARAGQRAVGKAAGTAQQQAGAVDLAGIQQEGRIDLEKLRQGNRLEVVKARGDESMRGIETRLQGVRSIEELKIGVRRELAAQEQQLRRDLAQAKNQETKDRLIDANDRVLVKMILKLKEDKQAAFGQIAPGLSAGEAYWQTLGSLSSEAIASFAARRKDESAFYALIIKMKMGGDPNGAPPSDTELDEIAKKVKGEYGITIRGARFRKFLEEAAVGD